MITLIASTVISWPEAFVEASGIAAAAFVLHTMFNRL